VLCIRNLLPAPHLAPRFAAAHVVVLFSATLGPAQFQRDTLGLPPQSPWVEVPAPFDASQLAVHLVAGISTRWADRARSVGPIADLIAAQYARQPGHYLAFFSSYDYLQRVAQHLTEIHPQVPAWTQSAGMSEAQRQAFLERFTPGGRGVGFAVLGGSFGEGIDLPGDRLVGAFIATLGLPQVNPVNEQLRLRLQQSFGAGFDYAYLYPGLRKVVQAAGRVIRTPTDRGVVYLIDDRYARSQVRALLPAWWQPQPHPVP
jgi:Rad3-related DNA helicase